MDYSALLNYAALRKNYGYNKFFKIFNLNLIQLTTVF